ncbi:dihydroorotate dehydrogenase electron transfer subunit [Caproicibacterium sp. BJN0003]|uniref:dihydroorotate dehydrogenase electron transfer subunit n=1 Tax=Caproicibacterium sp. BJN0003 TaxID=2994078 RepID=UPI00225B0557|nr:dihydroorotate dehydrogenase electron transfer subunit [Caproicibacterium sp. BJN0003]UZT81892.1 dihydroorotate dehydrogenase electron transfer subunit [Caproicibacterium sp. BJN0003]
MKYDVWHGTVIRKEVLTQDIFDFTVKAPTLVPMVKPGQFANILVPNKILRRPISICSAENGLLRFVFQIRGEGTQLLSRFQVGDTLDFLAPLGNGFPVEDLQKKAIFVGGGIGVPPLLGLAQKYGKNGTAALGFRSKEAVILEKEFAAAGSTVKIATDDGSFGHHGFAADFLKETSFDICYACGPKPMLKAVSELCKQMNKPCWISLEERMACGIGACLGCAVQLKRANGESYYGHVCKDGPVFSSEEVVL